MIRNPLLKRIFSVYVFLTLFVSGIFGFMIIGGPSSSAETVELIHDAGNLTFKVDNLVLY